MAGSTLRLKIEGPPDRVLATALASALTESLAILDNIGRVVTGRGVRAKAPIVWYVTKLESGSATAELFGELAVPTLDPDVIERVGANYVNGLQDVETAQGLPRVWSDASLTHLKNIAKPLGDTSAAYFEAAWVQENVPDAKVIQVTKRSESNLKELRSSQIQSLGSITGILDELSLRSRNGYRFQVYDDVSERPVTIWFERDDLEHVKEALGMRVVVSGVISRNAKGQPVRIDEPKFEPLPEGPPLTSIIGVAPDFLGGRSIREYLEDVN